MPLMPFPAPNKINQKIPFMLKNDTFLVRGSNAYFWSNLESGSKVFFSVFSCYIGIVLKETA